MVISLFAGIAFLSVERSKCPNGMTRCSTVLPPDPWTGSNRKGGRLQFGRVNGIKSEPWTTSSRYTWTDCVGICKFIAVMLAVRRPGVTEALQMLEREQAIRAERRNIVVLNRRKLEGTAGDSYGIPEAEYERLIGPLR
jgi:hypothetical protein